MSNFITELAESIDLEIFKLEKSNEYMTSYKYNPNPDNNNLDIVIGKLEAYRDILSRIKENENISSCK